MNNFDFDRYDTEDLTTFADGSDALANKGFTIAFRHMISEKEIFFKAFITNFNETYNSDWASEQVYGRVDGIHMFRSTSRSIALAFKVPASSLGEAYENLGRVQQLVQFLYPAYTNVNNASTIGQSPLVRIKIMNLLQRNSVSAESPQTFSKTLYDSYKSSGGSENGVLGFISSLVVNHNVESEDGGIFEKTIEQGDQKSGATVLPKMIDINISFTPIHDTPLGWFNSLDGVDFATPSFPYNAVLSDGTVTSVPAAAETGAPTTATIAQEDEQREAQDFTEQVLEELGGTVDASGIPIVETDLDLSGVVYSSTDTYDPFAAIDTISTTSVLTDSLKSRIGAVETRSRLESARSRAAADARSIRSARNLFRSIDEL